jgi:hypothetical protein
MDCFGSLSQIWYAQNLLCVLGYSDDNLWRMRKFYLQYRDNEKLAPMVQEISRTKNIQILEKWKNDLECQFYISMTKKYGWTST